MDFKKGCLRWVGLLIFSAVLYHPLWAFDWPATLLFDQFELGDLAAWQTPNATGDATVSMSQSIRHSGAYAVKLTIPNNTKTREANIVKGFAKSDTIYYRTYFYLDNDFTMGSSDYLAIFAPATSMEGAIFHVSFKKNQNNEIILVAAYFGITYATGSTPVAKQTWNCLEGKYITGSGDGKVAIFLNGIEECSNSTMELPARPEKIVIGPNFMSEGATVSGTMYVDDVVVDRKPIGPCATGIFLAYPDLRGRVGAKTVAILTGDEPTDRLTASLTSTNGLNQKILDLPGPLNGRAEFPVVLNNIPASVYTLTVQLLDASAQEKARATFSFEKTYDGNPTFSIDADNNIIFNDKKFFPITSFGLGITSITDWATKGYINILYSIDWGGPLGIPGYKEYLDTAQKAGLYCIGPTHDDRFDQEEGVKVKWKDADVKEYITNLKDHPANAWWLWREEPDNWGYSAQTYKGWWDIVKQSDPKHLTEILLMGEEYLGGEGQRLPMKEYNWPNLCSDIYAWDIYPVENEYRDMGFDAFAYAQDCARTWNFDLVPVFTNIQTADCTPGEYGGTPTPTEIYSMCWISIIHGAKGLHWYPYQGEVTEENYAAMAKMVTDVTALTEAILGAQPAVTVSKQVSDGGQIDIMTKSWNNKTYIFAANIKRQKETAGFTLSSSGGQTSVAVYGEGRSIPIANSGFSDSFDPLQVHVYILSSDVKVGRKDAEQPSIRFLQNQKPDRVVFTISAPRTTALDLAIYDSKGRSIWRYHSEQVFQGKHSIEWRHGKGINAEMVYFVRLKMHDMQIFKKVCFMR